MDAAAVTAIATLVGAVGAAVGGLIATRRQNFDSMIEGAMRLHEVIAGDYDRLRADRDRLQQDLDSCHETLAQHREAGDA